MGELMIKPQNLVSLFHGTDITELPFQKDIFLYRTFIAGTSYVEGIEELASDNRKSTIGSHKEVYRNTG